MNTPGRRRWLGLACDDADVRRFRGGAGRTPPRLATKRRSAADDSRRYRTGHEQLLRAHARGRPRAQCAAAHSRNGYARRPRLRDARNDPGDPRFAGARGDLCLAVRLTRGERRHVPAVRQSHRGDGAGNQSRRRDAGADRRRLRRLPAFIRRQATRTTRRRTDKAEPGTAHGAQGRQRFHRLYPRTRRAARSQRRVGGIRGAQRHQPDRNGSARAESHRHRCDGPGGSAEADGRSRREDGRGRS